MNNQSKTNRTLLILVLLTLVVLIILTLKKNDRAVEGIQEQENQTESIIIETGDQKQEAGNQENNSAHDDVTHPPAPGPWKGDAVIDFSPTAFSVGQNVINAKLKGLLFEGIARIEIYDGTTLVYSNNVEAIPGAQMGGNYIAISPETITIPPYLQGKTLIVRFIGLAVKDGTKPPYWGTTIEVQ